MTYYYTLLLREKLITTQKKIDFALQVPGKYTTPAMIAYRQQCKEDIEKRIAVVNRLIKIKKTIMDRRIEMAETTAALLAMCIPFSIINNKIYI